MEQQHQQEKPDLTKDWGYSEYNGPHKWVEAFPIADGVRQSPIDIETCKAVHDQELMTKHLNFMYKPEAGLELSNTGHSIQATIRQHSELCGGPLAGKYRLHQFHLHWGSEKGRGSEHTINNETFDAELHLVHFNEKYGTFVKAVDIPDGLAVVGIMIKEGHLNQALSPVTNNAHHVAKNKDTFTVSGTFDPKSLLPDTETDYWTYQGSLTTPPLYESVTWIVLKNSVELSRDQLEDLRKMKDSHHLSMQDNYRPPCPLNGREVRKSFL